MKTLACVILVAGSVAVAGSQTVEKAEKKKPSITLRATPAAGFTPLKVFLTAELKGGNDDFEDYYCPAVEWVWGDDTRAESSADCEPYEPGTSKIRRRYSTSRIFQISGDMRVEFRLKQKDKVVGSAGTTITIRPGVRDGGG
jgi:hypothetical protein